MRLTGQTLIVFCVANAIALIEALRILEPEYYPRGPGPCGCENEEYSPVCADGKTYNNHCHLDCSLRREHRSVRTLKPGPCHGIEKSHEHEHEHEREHDRPPSCVCTMEYNPVCGSDGKTYSNGCVLRCASRNDPYLTQLKSGVCESDDNHRFEDLECDCGSEDNPICGRDGRTYNNYCHFRCHLKRRPNLRIQREGACPQPIYYDHFEPRG